MRRDDTARKAFLEKDIQIASRVHSEKLIKQAFLHHEKHNTHFNLPEIILGGQDGLVNVLGVILGIVAATSQNRIVIVAGLAATFAESISMAAVAYTSKLAEADFYQSEYERERWEIQHIPQGEMEEIRALYRNYGFEGKTLNTIVDTITSNKKLWLRVMMEQELKLSPIDRRDAIPTAFIVGFSALVGSFIPLTPYLLLPIQHATVVSLCVSSLSLFFVGYYKAKKTIGRKFTKSGIEMMVIGMISALVGFIVGSIFKV